MAPCILLENIYNHTTRKCFVFHYFHWHLPILFHGIQMSLSKEMVLFYLILSYHLDYSHFSGILLPNPNAHKPYAPTKSRHSRRFLFIRASKYSYWNRHTRCRHLLPCRILCPLPRCLPFQEIAETGIKTHGRDAIPPVPDKPIHATRTFCRKPAGILFRQHARRAAQKKL